MLRTTLVLATTFMLVAPAVQARGFGGGGGFHGGGGGGWGRGGGFSRGDYGSDFARGDSGSDFSMGDSGSNFARGDSGSNFSMGDSGSDFARGDSGANPSMGDSGSGFAMGDSASGFAHGDSGANPSMGDSGANFAMGNPGANPSMGDAGANFAGMGYHMAGGRNGSMYGLEDSAEWSYEHGGYMGGGGGMMPRGGGGRGYYNAQRAAARPQVSEADRVAAADQTYKWGFDKASKTPSTVQTAGAWKNTDTTALYDRASMIRGNFNNWNAFHDANWWNRYPNRWWVPGWGWDYGWYWGSWDDMVSLMGLAGTSDYYDYGGTITYNNNNVYYGSNSVGTQEQYYTEAQTLADTGSTSNVSDAKTWKPLGVYALAQGNQSSSNSLFQLAVDKNGDIGGNYYNELSNQVLPVKGKVDKKNQRVAFTVGSNNQVVYDTGLGNLLSAQAPILVHFSNKRTEQWTLVRLQQPQQSAQK